MKKTIIAAIVVCAPFMLGAVSVAGYNIPLHSSENYEIHRGMGEELSACQDVHLAQKLTTFDDNVPSDAFGYGNLANYVWLDRLCQNPVVPRMSEINLGPSLKNARVALVSDPNCFGPLRNTVAVLDRSGHELMHTFAIRLAPMASSSKEVTDIVVEGVNRNFFIYRWNTAQHRFIYATRVVTRLETCCDWVDDEEKLPHPTTYSDTSDQTSEDKRYTKKIKNIRHWIDEKSGTPAQCEDARLLKALGLAEAVWV